ncbi:MAG: PilZ domain-containing protein [Myxococcota bacterium]|nr:PilZ domain-containing protein [Myxococcota bacterium]
MDGRDRPRVCLDQDTRFFRARLSELLEEADCEVVKLDPQTALHTALLEVAPPPDLLIATLHPDPRAGVERIRALRELSALDAIPILAVCPLDRDGIDVPELRALGVQGLIDKRAIPEHVTFRVNQIVRTVESEQRRHVRAPCFFPVDVTIADQVTTEYALNLSGGGMRLTCTRALEPNTDVGLRFSLPGHGGTLLQIGARVMNCRAGGPGRSPYEAGVRFLDADPRVSASIAREVERLLEGTGPSL